MTPTEILDHLTTRVPALLSGRYREDRCIVSTRVALEVLRRLDVPCHPQAFAVDALNAAAVQAVTEGWLDDRDRTFAAGAKIVAVAGSGSIEDGAWDGHLALVIDGVEPILLDPSAGQFSRPKKGIEVEPFWALAPEWPAFYGDRRGALIRYLPVPVRSYRNSPDWTRSERWTPTVETILDEIASSRLDDVTGTD